MTLHLEAGSTILGSPRLEDYPVEGRDASGESERAGVVTARGAERVAITGRGTIDGNAMAFHDATRQHDSGDFDRGLTRQGAGLHAEGRALRARADRARGAAGEPRPPLRLPGRPRARGDDRELPHLDEPLPEVRERHDRGGAHPQRRERQAGPERRRHRPRRVRRRADPRLRHRHRGRLHRALRLAAGGGDELHDDHPLGRDPGRLRPRPRHPRLRLLEPGDPRREPGPRRLRARARARSRT
ncbi:MAG: hypothetical protein MZU95_14935 [Desulfomicrobium escambiense]|nr:hypothetical protein [Desulfomicrobium escambiense]